MLTGVVEHLAQVVEFSQAVAVRVKDAVVNV
jgi:hypothetical protein